MGNTSPMKIRLAITQVIEMQKDSRKRQICIYINNNQVDSIKIGAFQAARSFWARKCTRLKSPNQGMQFWPRSGLHQDHLGKNAQDVQIEHHVDDHGNGQQADGDEREKVHLVAHNLQVFKQFLLLQGVAVGG